MIFKFVSHRDLMIFLNHKVGSSEFQSYRKILEMYTLKLNMKTPMLGSLLETLRD